MLALIGGRVLPSPAGPSIEDGVILIRGGKIIAVGEKQHVRVPPDADVLDCKGKTITAGLWNCHVHFTGPLWASADTAPADQLTRAMRTMLTRYGFTNAFDTGSELRMTAALRRRTASGEVSGPTIRTAGEILFPRGAAAFMLADSSRDAGPGAPASPPRNLDLAQFEPTTPEQAVALVRRRIAGGADAIKLYAQAWWDTKLTMPHDVARAAIKEAHRRGRKVLVHPSGRYGLDLVAEGGVDILMHTTPETGPWPADLVARLKAQRVALTPTLKLWRFALMREGTPAAAAERFQEQGVQQLAAWFRAGGTVLFGTDIGYMTDYDPTEEYTLMAKSGMDFAALLAALTTNPAARFTGTKRNGMVVAGAPADLAVLDGDPRDELRSLARVRWTLRAGRVIFDAEKAT